MTDAAYDYHREYREQHRAQNAAGITPAGKALAAWMDAHMAEWVEIATTKESTR